jgi:hypothetical protein
MFFFYATVNAHENAQEENYFFFDAPRLKFMSLYLGVNHRLNDKL